MSDLVFVDANVFLYARDPRDPAKQRRARDWIAHLWRSGLGRTSVQALSEFYWNATRKFGVASAVAWGEVDALLAWKPRAVDVELIRAAREIETYHRLSWWDSTIVAAAQLEKCRVLLTEDLQDGSAIGTVVVRSPFTLELEQPAAAYEVAPVLASLHRRRGRPRRSAYA
jgi:predicted nucleic acid-binding protein